MIKRYLLPAQHSLYVSVAKIVCFVAGFGSGKTDAGCLKAIQLMEANPGLMGAFVEPTYKMVVNVAWPMMISHLETLGLRFRVRKSVWCIDVWFGSGKPSTVLFMSAEKPDTLKGTNLAWGIADEAGMMQEVAITNLQSRVGRAPGTRQAQLILLGTPEGGPGTWFGRWAEFEPAPGTLLIRARTEDNPFLPKFYVRNLRQTLSATEFEAYCNGIFVAEGGQIYRFDQSRHVQETDHPTQENVQVFADFNVGKMVWLIAKNQNGVIHVVDEVVGENTYTEDHIPRLRDKLQSMGLSMSGVPIYGDASARARKTSASTSDVVQLQAAGLTWRAPGRNPPVKDRIASLNNLLYLDRFLVHPRCKELKRCLASQGRDKNGDPDKRSGNDHGNDAAGYGVFGQYPVRHPQSKYERYQ